MSRLGVTPKIAAASKNCGSGEKSLDKPKVMDCAVLTLNNAGPPKMASPPSTKTPPTPARPESKGIAIKRVVERPKSSTDAPPCDSE